jgi:hypothetical protein
MFEGSTDSDFSPAVSASPVAARAKQATRLERAQALAAAARCRAAGQSERAAAAGVGRPRSTLRDWSQADVASSARVPAALAALFASEAGVRWLHRLVLAMQFVITLRAGGGVRLVRKNGDAPRFHQDKGVNTSIKGSKPFS